MIFPSIIFEQAFERISRVISNSHILNFLFIIMFGYSIGAITGVLIKLFYYRKAF